MLGQRDTSQAQLCVGVPALRRDHPDAWTLAVLNAVLGDGMSSRLFLSVREEQGAGLRRAAPGSSITPMPVRSRSRPASIRPRSARPSRRSSSSSPACATSRSQAAELAQGQGVPRPAASSCGWRRRATWPSWVGAQEALHDRVLTLDEAIEAVEAVEAADVQRARRRAVPGRAVAAGRRRPARDAAGTSTGGFACPDERPGPDGDRGAARAWLGAGRRAGCSRAAAEPGDHRRPRRAATALRLARLHLRTGSLGLARAELEALAGGGPLDPEGLVDLAEARWRTGDLSGAGEAATIALANGSDSPTAIVIAVEAVAALGRPGEARRLAARAVEHSDLPVDAIFAGMPRSPIWPDDPRLRPARWAGPRASCAATS